LESDEDLDLLFVKYHPDQITVAQLVEKIAAFGFRATVKKSNTAEKDK
jgi:hypothetical protein